MVDASPRTVPPPAGNPGHPRRGVAATTSAVATPASSPYSAPSQGIQGGQGGWEERKKKRGGCEGRLERSSSSDWGGARRGPARKQRAGGELRSRGGASLRDAARRKQGSTRWGPAGGCRAQAPGGGGAVLREPTPPSPASPRAARSAPGGDRAGPSGRAEAGEGPHGSGFLQTRSGREGSRRGRRGRRGACEEGAGEPMAPTRTEGELCGRGAGSREAAGKRGEWLRVPHQPVATSGSAGQLLTPA